MRKIDSLDVRRILEKADTYTKINFYFRRGQAVFNAAYDLFPKAADKLRSTEYDCYYDDSREDVFIERLMTLDAE